MSRHIAVDLGASGGRVAVGEVDDAGFRIKVVHRFPNGGVERSKGLYWDVQSIWSEVIKGVQMARELGGIDSIGVNSWGVDYALLDENGGLIHGVRHYRDPRTDHMPEKVWASVSRSEIFNRTGIQFMPINTLYQLAAQAEEDRGALERADSLLMVPDLFHYWLSGTQRVESTIASTSQLYDPRVRGWDRELIQRMRLPERIFRQIVEPGTVIGRTLPKLDLGDCQVIAPAAHDTASAVAAVPAEGGDWAFISCGTWALSGIEIKKPLITPDTERLNLTNEAGFGGTTRLLKNICGLWILQECRRAWGLDFESMFRAAEAARGNSIIDPDDPEFAKPNDNMPELVRRMAGRSGETVPESCGEITRCVLRSLALRCATVLQELEEVTGRTIDRIHIVGGGSQIPLLNQWIADASGRNLIAGPTEATLIGNLLVQAYGAGAIELQSIRAHVRATSEWKRFSPRTSSGS